MNRKIAFVSAAAFALGATLIHFYLERLEREISGGPPIDLLVAARDLQPGTVLTEGDVAVRQVPETYVDARRIRAKEIGDLLGLPIGTALSEGEGMVWSDVVGTGRTARQLSELVIPGMRGVTITSRSHLFEGLLRPGDRVDVLLTVPGDAGPVTTTLLQNVLVLSVGSNLGDAEGDASLGSGSVNVSVNEAQELAQAEQKGRLRLVLRNPHDSEIATKVPRPEASLPRARISRPEHKEIEHVR